MKTKNILIAALAALTFFSCSKEDNSNGQIEDDANLTIRITNPTSTNNRGIVETPGGDQTATVTYANSIVFVATANGAVKKAIVLDAAAGASGGQSIDEVPTKGQVFIVANIPTANLETVKALLTIKAVQEYVLTTAKAGTFPNVILTNSNGMGATYDAVATKEGGKPKANVAAAISPAVARIELPKIGLTDKAEIKSYDITGIYLDVVYESFFLKGDKGTGTKVDIKQDITNAKIDYYKNTGKWSSSTGVVVPEADKAWTYQIPAGDTPNIIIGITNIIMKDDTKFDGDDGTKPYFITARLTGTVTRASIYPMKDGILFDESNIHETPNPDITGGEVAVTITPEKWAIGELTYDLD